MILLTHPTGNEFVRQALAALDRAGMLTEFWTTINWNSDSQINRLFPPSMRETLARRSFPESVRSRTHTAPLRESIRLLAGALDVSSRHETGAFSVDAVFRELDRKVANRLHHVDNLGAAYAYEDGALQTF